MYFKGALFLHTLRNAINNDKKWWALVRSIYNEFKYKNIMTEDMVKFVNSKTEWDWTAVFNQYLRRISLPVLELRFEDNGRTVAYRWQADEPGFNLPIRVGEHGKWQTILPTTTWQRMPTTLSKDAFEVATDLFFVNVNKS